MSERDVQYNLREVDEMPKPEPRGGSRGARGPSAIVKLALTLAEDPTLHKRVFLLADYGKREGASASAQNLRNKLGWNATHNGFDFKVGRVDTVDDEGFGDIRHGIYATYNPDRIVEGAWAKEQGKRVRAAEKRKAARSEVKAELDQAPSDAESAIERLMSA
ncbi:MAG: hypothetical protein OK436_05905 [Thaumarchaeota archaeon]|nr:hypothetical protein [Nitrososphaerota archaeon]